MSTEIEKISPEGLAVAEAYLECGQDASEAARMLGLPLDEVDRLLSKRETKAFIDRIYHESGFRNRHRMGELMDAIIAKKLEEMDDTGLGSQKDIIDILQVAHKMKMEQLQLELKLQDQKPGVQINTQINNGGGDNYNKLLEKVLNAGK
jgi:hypothetical protein